MPEKSGCQEKEAVLSWIELKIALTAERQQMEKKKNFEDLTWLLRRKQCVTQAASAEMLITGLKGRYFGNGTGEFERFKPLE